MRDYVKDYIEKSINTKDYILQSEVLLSHIERIAEAIIQAYQNDKKVLIAGNGGSAADAQHIVAELVSKFTKERKALNAIALTTNTSILTAISNDYGFEEVFARQIEAYGSKGDIYIAISTSGISKNIIRSAEKAKQRGLFIIGLTGKASNDLDKICDLSIKVPSEETSIIQEAHIMIGHILCGIIERTLF